jgi:hypothetical protein
MAYDTDPDIAAFLTGGKSSAINKIPTKEPSMDQLREVAKKKKLTDANPQMQADADVAPSDYSSDPDVSAFLTGGKSSNLKVTSKNQEPVPQIGNALLGAGEVGLSALTGAIAAPLGAATGIIANLRSGKYGTKEGMQVAEEQAKNLMGQMTYQPRTEKGQEYMGDLQSAFEASKLPPIMPEVLGMKPERKLAGQAADVASNQLEAQFGGLKKPNMRMETVPPVAIDNTSKLQSGGAAAVAQENAVKAALSEATPELRASLGDKLPQEFTPQELKALEIHNKFAKVDPDFVPTEGQALQDIAKLSDEYNQKAQPGNEALRAKFEQRDPMLIKGFNNIKEQFAPEHSGIKLEGKANNILEEVKTNRVDVDTANIKKAYGELQSEDGKFAVDMKQASENALAKIEAEDRLDKLPKTIKDKLEKYINGAEGNLNKFENLRSDVASEQRLANRQGDGTASHVLGLVRDALEELPMKGDQALAFKEKADIARSLFAQQKGLLDPKKPTYNKLYAMAYEDNRTPAEILMGNVPHPAANKFFDNFVAGSKSTPADLSRMIELVGKDSPAHQELIAGLVDYIKQKAGVIDDKGNVNQIALRKELNKLDGRLDIVAGPEVANKLRNIGEVAELSEHVKNRSGGNANVSQTAITSEREAAQKAVKDVAMGATKAALNIKTGGASGIVESVLSPIFEAKKAKKAAEAASLAQQEKLQQSISRSAGISKPTRIELRGMANKEK